MSQVKSMNQTLVQDVVTEVMRRLSTRAGVPKVGEDAPANETKRREAEAHPHSITVPTGQYGIYSKVDDAVAAADESQKKLMKLSLDDRDGIVKLVKSMAKSNARAWGELEFA